MQQTPSDQLLQMVETPVRSLARVDSLNTAGAALPQRAEPYVYYDYNQIKQADPQRMIPEFVPGSDAKPRPLPKHIQVSPWGAVVMLKV